MGEVAVKKRSERAPRCCCCDPTGKRKGRRLLCGGASFLRHVSRSLSRIEVSGMLHRRASPIKRSGSHAGFREHLSVSCLAGELLFSSEIEGSRSPPHASVVALS